MNKNEFKINLINALNFKENPYHPLVWISGKPSIGKKTFIGGFTEINATDSKITIGENCDIATFVSINVADSHKRCIGLSLDIQRKEIEIGNNVFIGSFSMIKGGAKIGHNSVVAAGTIVDAISIPPYSLVSGNPMIVKAGYYKNKKK